jgi:hypothetical protein
VKPSHPYRYLGVAEDGAPLVVNSPVPIPALADRELPPRDQPGRAGRQPKREPARSSGPEQAVAEARVAAAAAENRRATQEAEEEEERLYRQMQWHDSDRSSALRVRQWQIVIPGRRTSNA